MYFQPVFKNKEISVDFFLFPGSVINNNTTLNKNGNKSSNTDTDVSAYIGTYYKLIFTNYQNCHTRDCYLLSDLEHYFLFWEAMFFSLSHEEHSIRVPLLVLLA